MASSGPGRKIVAVVILAALLGLFFAFDLGQYLSFAYVKENLGVFKSYAAHNQVLVVGIYAAVYIAVAALSLPGAAILTLLGGALFGLGLGTVVVSFASTAGASLAFLMARFFLRDTITQRFGDKLTAFNEGVRRDGAFYLFTLRLIPIFPFFLINVVMGLTPMGVGRFFVVSQLGMLPGTAVYVNAGMQLAQIESLGGLLSPALLASFCLLGIFPWLAKGLVSALKARQVYRGYERPRSYDYNVVAIGAGSAGLVTAYIAAAVKARVALVERHKMGGDCLNTGCVPSKALLRSAKMVHYGKRANDFGLDAIDVSFRFSEVMERVQRAIAKIEPHDSVERYSGLGVECVTGEAKIKSPWEVDVGGRVLTTKNIVIATGARPAVPAIKGIEDCGYLTSDTFWELRELPKRLVVLGGGPIGCELAQAMARLGSQVTQVEIHSRIMTIEDEDVSAFIAERLQAEGVTHKFGHSAREVRRQGAAFELVCDGPGGSEEIIPFDKLLVSVGRRANVTGFGLEELGIELRENGTIATDEYLRTRFPNIYACGDVTGPYQLTHTAAHQAWFCAVNALFGRFKKFKVDYRVIPWCTYTDPEVATVGLNRQAAERQGIPYDATTYGIDDLDRAIADSEDHGWVQVLTAKGTDKIIGATIVGNHASDIIVEFIAAMKHGFGLNKILGTIHIYPTMGEANKFAAGVWKKGQVSAGLLGRVEAFHRWQRG